MLRNVGNLARTDEPSVAAALDYALLHLGVKNVGYWPIRTAAVKATRHPEHLDTEGLRLWLGEEHFDGADVEEAARAQESGSWTASGITPSSGSSKAKERRQPPCVSSLSGRAAGDLCQRPWVAPERSRRSASRSFMLPMR